MQNIHLWWEWVWAHRAEAFTILAPVLATSIVGTFFTVRVTRWLKRPKLHIRLSKIGMRFEDIFSEGYLETGIAEISERSGTLQKVPNLKHFLDRYIELEMSISGSPRLSISGVSVKKSDGTEVDIGDALRVPGDHVLEIEKRPTLEENIARVFYVKEGVIGDPRTILSISARDNQGNNHQTGRIRDFEALDRGNYPRFDFTESGDDSLVEASDLKQAPSRLNFGPYLPNLGPHIGATLQPSLGSPYQAPIDDEEAEHIVSFIRRLPGCNRFGSLTVREGAIFSDIEPLTEQDFFAASKAIHIVDNGTITSRFIGALPDRNDVFHCLLVTFAVALYLRSTRFTVNEQSLTLGYWVGGGTSSTLLPPADSKYGVIHVAGDFATQCTDIVVDVLRGKYDTAAKRTEIAEELRAYWNVTFPAGIEDVVKQSHP